MRRTALLLAFTLLFGLAFAVAQGEWRPGEVRKIVDGVWFRLGEIEEYGHCNNTIIEMADYLIVVDANFPSGAELTLAAAKKVSSKPVRYVFDTHHHGDHAYGNAFWTANGATTVAYVGVAQEMRRYEPARWARAAQDREDVRKLNRDSVEPPQQTFDQSPHVIEDSSRRVELHHFGWAHTRGDAFAYLPADKLIATGDAIVNGAFNYTGDGNTGNWPNVIRQVKRLDIERVLPGHGPPGGMEIRQRPARLLRADQRRCRQRVLGRQQARRCRHGRRRRGRRDQDPPLRMKSKTGSATASPSRSASAGPSSPPASPTAKSSAANKQQTLSPSGTVPTWTVPRPRCPAS